MDDVRGDVRKDEVARPAVETREAQRLLAVDADDRGRAADEVDYVDADGDVRHEQSVATGDDLHRGGEEATGREVDAPEVLGENELLLYDLDLPHGDETGLGSREAPDGRNELRLVLAEEKLADGAEVAAGRGGLGQTEGADGVRDGRETVLLVDVVAADRNLVRICGRDKRSMLT